MLLVPVLQVMVVMDQEGETNLLVSFVLRCRGGAQLKFYFIVYIYLHFKHG
jgi:hypothetical protein